MNVNGKPVHSQNGNCRQVCLFCLFLHNYRKMGRGSGRWERTGGEDNDLISSKAPSFAVRCTSLCCVDLLSTASSPFHFHGKSGFFFDHRVSSPSSPHSHLLLDMEGMNCSMFEWALCRSFELAVLWFARQPC